MGPEKDAFVLCARHGWQAAPTCSDIPAVEDISPN